MKKVNLDLKFAHRLICPRVVYIITTISKNGVVNAGSFTNLTSVSSNPQRLVFSTVERNDTFKNIRQTREFVVNIPSVSLLEKVWICGDKYAKMPIPSHISELTVVNFTPISSEKVKPPRIKECFGHLECKVVWIRNVGDHFLILGEVVAASCNEGTFDRQFIPRVEKTKPLLQISGPYFTSPSRKIEVKKEKVKSYLHKLRELIAENNKK